MSKSLLLVFIFALFAAAVLCQVPPKKHCVGKNEVWNHCASACPATCKHPKSSICHTACKPGCQCRSGYLRNHQKHCVLPKQCPKN